MGYRTFRNSTWLSLFLGACCLPVLAQRPNIIFLFSDDHAAQAVSAYGSRINRTPNMDRLAEEGMLFRRAYVTNALCGPSRAVIQTGKLSHVNGFEKNEQRFDGSQPTFPKLLQKAGYQTAVVGKWHLESDPQGFDYWEIMPGQGLYYNPAFIKNGVRSTRPGYNSEIVTTLGLDWLKNQRDKAKPFMLMLQFKAPHRTWEPGPGDLDLFDNTSIPEPDNLFDDYASRGSAAQRATMRVSRDLTPTDLKLVEPAGLNAEQLAAWRKAYNAENEAFRLANPQGKELVKWKYQRYIKDYLRCVASVDDGIGRVLKYLGDSGLASNTVVMYSSDNGFFLGEHGWFDKRFMYEESMQVPFMVRWPGTIQPKSSTDRIVSNLDFAETFLDIAGVPVPADMQGKSLVPLMKGQTPPDWRKTFYYQYFGYPDVHDVYRHYGVTDGRYKLIYFHDVDEWEFYDLKYDAREMKNQYHVPEHQAIIQGLKQELEKLRTAYKVPPSQLIPNLTRFETQRITQPIPKAGCTDARYREFDAEADTHLPSACKTLSTALQEASLITGVEGSDLFVTGFSDRVIFRSAPQAGERRISIRTPGGRVVASLAFRGDIAWTKAPGARGLHIATLEGAGGARSFKLIL